jgi:hypothetical protein
MDEELEGLNDAGTTHLPDPGQLHVRGEAVDAFGQAAEVPIGRATSPALWRHATLHPGTAQFRVWRNENGRRAGLGDIDAEATEADFIRMFLASMPQPKQFQQYFLRPVNSQGREIGTEFDLIISGDHVELQRIREGDEDEDLPMFAPEPDPEQSLTIRLAMRQIEAIEAQAREDRRRAEQERMDAQAQRERLAQNEVNLAQNAATTLEAMTMKIMEQDRMRSEQAMKDAQLRAESTMSQTRDFFSTQIATMREERQADKDRLESERQRERDRAENERDRLRLEFQQQQEAAKAAAEEREREWRRRQEEDAARAREKEEAEARENERKRAHELRLEEMKLKDVRDREHAERMAQYALQAQGKGGGVKETIKEALSFATDLGIDIKDILGRVTGGGGGEWIGLLEKLVDKAGDAATIALEAKMNQQPAPTPATARKPKLIPTDEPEEAIPRKRPPVVQPVGAQAVNPQAQQQQEGALGLPAQKRAREVLKHLVAQLKSANQDAWEQILRDTASAEYVVIHFFRQMSAARALTEAGLDPAAVPTVIQLLAQTGLHTEE